ncbi:unnamed protein product, partial [Brenthis ino]
MMTKPIELPYQITRGLRTKCEEFKQNILSNDFALILVTESWFSDDFYNGEICDDRYDIFRYDRKKGTSSKNIGGGVLLCALKILQVQHRSEWTCPTVESLWVTIPSS